MFEHDLFRKPVAIFRDQLPAFSAQRAGKSAKATLRHPLWLRGRGGPPVFLLFLISSPSKTRGVARHRAHGLVLSQTGPVNYSGRPGDRSGSGASADAPASFDAPRGVPAFAFNGRRTRRLRIKPEGLPGGRPGMWVRTTPAGTASRPTLATPREVRPSVDETEIHL